MPKSQSTPKPSHVFVLCCLAVMLVTSVKIWQQSFSSSAMSIAGGNATINAEQVSATTVAPSPTAPVEPRPPRYGAEIRAENVLAAAQPSIGSPSELTDATTLAAAPIQLPGPQTVQIPLEAPSLEVLNPGRGLENPPTMVLTPLQSSADLFAETATPPLDRLAATVERTAPIIMPPATVAAPRSPAVIAGPPIAQPMVMAPDPPTNDPAGEQNAPDAKPSEVAEIEFAPPTGESIVQQPAIERAQHDSGPNLPLPPLTGTVASNPEPELPSLSPIDRPSEPLEMRDFAEVVESDTKTAEPIVATPTAVPPSEIPSSVPAEAVSEGTASQLGVRDTIAAARAKAAADAATRKKERPTRAVSKSAWPVPRALVKELEQLKELQVQAGTEAIVAWAQQIQTTLTELQSSSGLNSVDAQPSLRKLHYLTQNAPQVNNSFLQSKVMVTRYAVERRLAVWNHVQSAMSLDVNALVSKVQLSTDDQQVVEFARNLRQFVGQGQQAAEWNRFLMLDSIERLAISSDSRGGSDRADVAARLLTRMNREELTPNQRAVVQSPTAKQLQVQLRRWTTTDVAYPAFLAAIERLEADPSFRSSNGLADMANRLQWSYAPQQNQLATTFYSHYRNANTRMAVTETLLNRMLPIVRDSQTPIREQILGARVFGKSASWTKIRLDLVPDNRHMRMKLVANGRVNAQTTSIKGPAVVFNRNQSQFNLQKMITADARGIHVGKSTTTASTKLSLLGLRTEYDGVPLIGRIVRSRAKDEINQQRNRVRGVIENRVANHAQTMVDTQLTQQLVAVEKRLEEKLVQPLRRLQLDPTVISLQTTNDRLVYRGRLAAEHHLAAFTPRPNALANSVASLQVHESTINNAIERMHVDGRRGDLREMLIEAANSRPNAKFQVPDDVPSGIVLELADTDAIRMRWHDGNMRIIVRFAELSYKRYRWKNFSVSTNYRPRVTGLDAELYRDGIVSLDGEGKRLKNQVALRSVFNLIFSKNRNIPLVPENLAKDRRLADLRFTQFLIRDGWIGVSIGQQTPQQARRRGNNNRR